MAFNSVDIPVVAILRQVLNQMEHMVLSWPLWERSYSADFTVLRIGQHILRCHSFCELSVNFYLFL